MYRILKRHAAGHHRHTIKLHRAIIPALVLSRALQAYPVPRQLPPSSEILLNANGANDAFSAVGRFRAALTCTGSLIDPSGLGAPDAKAWLLSAGHCISFEPYGVIRNQPSTAQVQFNFFIDPTEVDNHFPLCPASSSVLWCQ